MIHFSRNDPFVFIWNINLGTSFFKKQISSPTFKTHIAGEEEWNLLYIPKVEDGLLDRLILERALIDMSKEHVALSYKMEILTNIENTLSSGEKQGNFSKGSYSTWEFSKGNFENLNFSPHDLTIKIFMWGFSSEYEISRILARTELEEESASVLWKIDGLNSSVVESKIVDLPTTSKYRLTFETNDKENVKLTLTQIDFSCEGSFCLIVDAFCFDSKGQRNSLLKAEHKFDRANKIWKISPFIKKCQMSDENCSLIINDGLTLQIKLTAYTGRSKESIVEFQYGPQQPEEVFETEEILMSPRKKSLSILQSDFSSLYKNRNMMDVIFQLGENSLQAHKCVLIARSPVFSAMFEQQMLENANNHVDIQDIDYDTFDIMMKFLYDAVLPKMDFEIAKNLMIASDKYQILSLKDECAEFLKSNIKDENACEVLMLSDMLSDEKLKLSVIDFIKPNKKVLLKSAEWKELAKNNRVLVTEVLTSLVMDE